MAGSGCLSRIPVATVIRLRYRLGRSRLWRREYDQWRMTNGRAERRRHWRRDRDGRQSDGEGNRPLNSAGRAPGIWRRTLRK